MDTQQIGPRDEDGTLKTLNPIPLSRHLHAARTREKYNATEVYPILLLIRKIEDEV